MTVLSPRNARRTRWFRALFFTLLLLGPTVFAEALAIRSLDELYPFIRGYTDAADTKSLILARVGCPDLLSLGTSQSDHTINQHYLEGQELDGAIGRVFNFAIAGERGVNMYAIWRHVAASGCTPRVVVVEAGPAVINSEVGGYLHDAPFLGAGTMLAIPSGYFAERGYGLAEIVELATFDRLFIKRRGEKITEAVLDWAGWKPSPKTKKRPVIRPDGRITGLPNKRLDEKRYATERKKRRRLHRRGKTPYLFAEAEAEGVERLIEAATASGSRVILHSPPTTRIYQEIIEEAGGDVRWCAWHRKLRSRDDVEWFSEFSGEGYGRKDFHDYIHVNRRGARKYVRRLLEAANERRFPADPYCAGR